MALDSRFPGNDRRGDFGRKSHVHVAMVKQALERQAVGLPLQIETQRGIVV